MTYKKSCFYLLSFLSIALLFSSCIGNKKLVYLQNDDLKNKKSIPVDTVLRDYELHYSNYRIQAHDILMVTFNSLSEAEYDVFEALNNNIGGGGGGALLTLRGELVDPAGDINFPLIGKIHVQGKTIFEISDELTAIASKYVEEPSVKVRLLNFRFTILGEVNSESTVSTQNTRTTFMEAISLAGGLSELADRSRVKVIRQKGSKAEIFYLNLLDETFLESDNFYVYQNDIIVVPPLPQRPVRKYYSQNLSLLISTVSAALLLYNIFLQ